MNPRATPEGPAPGPDGRPAPAPGSERAVREGVAATSEGDAALVPGGHPEERPAADGAEPPARLERRLRLQGLAGMSVLGSDGKTVGRVRDIYQQDAGGELAAITVMPRQLSSRTVLIPSAAIAALPDSHSDEPPGDVSDDRAAGEPSDDRAAEGEDETSDEDEASDPRPADAVRLRVEAAVVRDGAAPPQTGHATPEQLREASAALGLDAAAQDGPGGHVGA